LTGERAHYELAAGRSHVAEHLAQAMETIAGEAGLLPEQIWDGADIPRARTLPRPSLGFGHAARLDTCRISQIVPVAARRPCFDQPAQTVGRYLVRQVTSDRIVWRFNNKVRAMTATRTLRVETLAAAVVRWSTDGWHTVHDTATRDTTLGVHVADLGTRDLRGGDQVHLTVYWPEAARWEGVDFLVCIE
jgi:glucoamylase